MTQNPIRAEIQRDTEFLRELFIDPEIVSGKTDLCITEVGKRALDIAYRFEVNPKSITVGNLQDLVASQGSQISNQGRYLSHLVNTAGIARRLANIIGTKHPELDLPDPDVAFSMGLVHDLNATFSDYNRTGQQTKEADLYFLAKRLGWDTLQKHVSMHSVYLEALLLMSKGAIFPKQEAYLEMIRILKGDGPFAYPNIEAEIADARTHFTLRLISVADYLENGKPYFDPTQLRQSFKERTEDIMLRYYHNDVIAGKTVSLIGQALNAGGLKRIEGYKDQFLTLL